MERFKEFFESQINEGVKIGDYYYIDFDKDNNYKTVVIKPELEDDYEKHNTVIQNYDKERYKVIRYYNKNFTDDDKNRFVNKHNENGKLNTIKNFITQSNQRSKYIPQIEGGNHKTLNAGKDGGFWIGNFRFIGQSKSSTYHRIEQYDNEKNIIDQRDVSLQDVQRIYTQYIRGKIEQYKDAKTIDDVLRLSEPRKNKHTDKEKINNAKLKDFIKTNKKYLKDQELDIENATIDDLKNLQQEIKDNPEYQKDKALNWQEHERNIVNGVKDLIDDGFFKVKSNGKIEQLTQETITCRGIGGSNKSDVMVYMTKDRSKNFYIESKLNYKDAEYFKFGVTVDGNNIRYDHSKHIEGLEDDEVEYINKVFDSIRLPEILTNIIVKEDGQITKEWTKFMDNWNALIEFIKEMFNNDKNFKDYDFKYPNNKFPQQFSQVAGYYQDYYKYYAEVYDKIIDIIFKKYGNGQTEVKHEDETYTISDFKLKRDDITKDDVFESASTLMTIFNIDRNNLPSLFKEILQIEGKFNALMKVQEIRHYRDLGLIDSGDEYSGKVERKNALKYFYQMFISETGRKKANEFVFKDVGYDNLGTMKLVPEIQFEDNKIKKAITNYYLNKDNCAYIQVDKDIFLLRDTFDPLNLKTIKEYNLRVFKDIPNMVTCQMVVSDKLDKISLHIKLQDIDEEREHMSFDIRDEEFIGEDSRYKKYNNENSIIINLDQFGKRHNIKKIDESEGIEEGTKISQTASDQFEKEIATKIQNFFQQQKSPYNKLKVEHYEESDLKYWSDIKITNPNTNKNVWVEVKENKYANLGSSSFKYNDGKWTCTTLEENDPMLPILQNAIEEHGSKFIDFCKSYLKKDNIKLPTDLTEDLIDAWKKSGNITDTDNDVQFITDKIQIKDFGSKIAEYYKTAKNEPAYYMQVGDDLYIIDKNFNIFSLKTRDGKELKSLSEAYRIGRIQFRAKGIQKEQKYYYSIYCDVKILADKENQDEEYSCSFLTEDKWPIIENTQKETINERDFDFHLKRKEDEKRPEYNRVAFDSHTKTYGGDDYINSYEIFSRICENPQGRERNINWFTGSDHLNYSNSMILAKIDDGKDTTLEIQNIKKSYERKDIIYVFLSKENGMTTQQFAKKLGTISAGTYKMNPKKLVIMNKADESVYVCNGMHNEGDNIILKFEWGDIVDYDKTIMENELELDDYITEFIDVDENLTIPENPDDKIEKELRNKLEKNYDHADRIIRWYRNAKRNGVDEKDLKRTFVDNIDNIKDLFKTYEKYIDSLKKMKMLNKKVEINGKQFDVVKDVDKIRLLDGFRELVKQMGNSVNSGTSISTSNQKYAITNEDRSKIRILGFTDNVVCWCTEDYETTNKFIYQLWLNAKTLGRGDVYGDPENQTPYCTHSREHWDDYSEDVERYQQFWYLTRLDKLETAEIHHTIGKIFKMEKGIKTDEYGFIQWDDASRAERNEIYQNLAEKFKNIKYSVGDLNNEQVVSIFNLMKGSGSSTILAMNDTTNDFLGRDDDHFSDFEELGNYGEDISKLHGQLFNTHSSVIKMNIGGVDLNFKESSNQTSVVPKIDIKDNKDDNGKVNVFNGDIRLEGDDWKKEKDIPNFIGMPKNVNGTVYISSLKNIRSLEGMSETVDGRVMLNALQIDSLEHFPKTVRGPNIDISRTNITNLNGLPKDFKGAVEIYRNKLTSLEGCPSDLFRLEVEEEQNLETLKGVGGNIPSLVLDDLPNLKNLDYVSINTKVTVDGCENITKDDLLHFDFWRGTNSVIKSFEQGNKSSNSEDEKFLKSIIYYKKEHTIDVDGVSRYKTDGMSLNDYFVKFGYGQKNKEETNEGILKYKKLCESLQNMENENMDSYKFITNIPQDIIDNAIENQKIENPRFEAVQFKKYFGLDNVNWCALVDKDKYLSIAAIQNNTPFDNYFYIMEIQTLVKGYGKPLLEEIIKKYQNVWLMANYQAGSRLNDYYRRQHLKEFIIPDSVFDCPVYFYYTDKCDEDKIRTYLTAFYSKEENPDEINESGEGKLKFKEYNANYFGTKKNGDCAIRALCITTGYGYKKICEMLGVDFMMGVGYGWSESQGISKKQLDEFSRKYGIIESAYTDDLFYDWLESGSEDENMDSTDGFSLEDTIVNNFIPDNRKYRRLVVMTHSNSAKDRKESLNLHCVPVDNHTKTYYDLAGNESVRYAIVDQIYYVNPDKVCPKDSPDSYENERQQILQQFRNNLLKKSDNNKNINEDESKQYAYHVSNVDPEIIKKDGFKSGLGNGATDTNLFQDLYDMDYPKNYLFISKEPWDLNRNTKYKYCYKIDITNLDLYPDFGMLNYYGAYHEDGSEEDGQIFWWEDKDIRMMKNKKFKDFLEKQDGQITTNEMMSGETIDGEYFPDALYDALGSAVVDGDIVNKENRIVDVETRENMANEDIVDDIIGDYKKIKSTNEQNPDTRKIMGSEILYLTDILDGRLVLVDVEGNVLRRNDDNGEMFFDDPGYAIKWAEERGYKVDNPERKNFQDVDEADRDIGGEKSDISNEINGIKIWIDDIREAPEGFTWFKSVREFIDYVDKNGTDKIELIDTDHDAGDYQKFGGDYIRCFDYLDFIGAKNVTIHIHSANPVGANNIRRIISRNKEENNWKEVRNT